MRRPAGKRNTQLQRAGAKAKRNTAVRPRKRITRLEVDGRNTPELGPAVRVSRNAKDRTTGLAAVVSVRLADVTIRLLDALCRKRSSDKQRRGGYYYAPRYTRAQFVTEAVRDAAKAEGVS